MPPDERAHIVVLSSLFPSSVQPAAGLFVRERMFRVGRQLPLAVVAPTPWFPFQSILRRLRPGFRPGAPRYERQGEFDVWYPRFLSVPGILKTLDGVLMALGAWPRLRRLKREGRLDLIDAHFAYPDGYAATLLGRWLDVPVTVTLRGKEARQVGAPALRRRITVALLRASRIFTVSDALRREALALGVPAERVRVVGNGVDTGKFTPLDRDEARRRLGLPPDAHVLVSVGGLVERKGFHRVIECLPALAQDFPDLHYLVVGGSSQEGDMTGELKRQVAALGLESRVHFLGVLAPRELCVPLSAADVFVLATRYEGWANVFLEAMACGLPVVTTRVGGNAEVVRDPKVGLLVPFGEPAALRDALRAALRHAWDRPAIRAYAQAHAWDSRVASLVGELGRLASRDAELKGACRHA